MKSYIHTILLILSTLVCSGQIHNIELPYNGTYNKIIKYEGDSVYLLKRYSKELGKLPPFLNITSKVLIKSSKKLEVYIDYITFENGADFSGSTFSSCNFYHSTFQGNSDFTSTNYNSPAYCQGVSFEKFVSFKYAKLYKESIFSASNFDDGIDFSNATFGFYADFESSVIKNELGLNETEMPNVFNLNHVRNLKADFRNAKTTILKQTPITFNSSLALINDVPVFTLRFKKDSTLFALSKKLNKCILQLRGTNLENVIIPFDRFWVDTTDYTYEEKTALYQKLIKNCKEEGMDESVQNWSIELKKIDTIHNWPNLGNFFNQFQFLFWNYGFEESLILLWVVLIFIGFSLINCFNGMYSNLLKVYFNPELSQNLFPKTTHILTPDYVISYIKRNKLIRLKYILHYTGVLFWGLKLEHTNMNFKNLFWVFIFYFQYVTGIILLGFLLNFVLSK